MRAVAAEARRELEIMAREHEAFPNNSRLKKGNLDKEGKPDATYFRDFERVDCIPFDVSEERAVVEKAIYDWNASHFSNTGIMLDPLNGIRCLPGVSAGLRRSSTGKLSNQGTSSLQSSDTNWALRPEKRNRELSRKSRSSGRPGSTLHCTFRPRTCREAPIAPNLRHLSRIKSIVKKTRCSSNSRDVSSLRDHLTRHLPKIVH